MPQEFKEEMTLVVPLSQEYIEETTLKFLLSQTYTEEETEWSVEQKLTGTHVTQKKVVSSEADKMTASTVPTSEEVDISSKTQRKLPMQKETEENGE